eukprot:m.167881 g.167881  ORF g.167881 m.167881 type:complete len:65 (-) comp14737_c1_seq1:76-270(-)
MRKRAVAVWFPTIQHALPRATATSHMANRAGHAGNPFLDTPRKSHWVPQYHILDGVGKRFCMFT